MTDNTRFLAPPNIGETTLRIVLDHFPEAQSLDETGQTVFSADVLAVMRMVKGLRNHNAGQETIRRVIDSYVPAPEGTQSIPVRRAPGVVAQDARKKTSAIADAVEAVADRFDDLAGAVAELSRSIDAFSRAAEAAAPDARKYDAFLGDLARLIAVSRRQRPEGA